MDMGIVFVADDSSKTLILQSSKGRDQVPGGKLDALYRCVCHVKRSRIRSCSHLTELDEAMAKLKNRGEAVKQAADNSKIFKTMKR